jgi:hypothetical protein
MSRFGNVPIIYTRIGLLADNLIEVSKKYPTVFTRNQFVEIIGSKPTSTADKLRDMVSYGLIIRNNDTYTISESGQAIIKGSPAERSSKIEIALNKCPVWNYLITTVGKRPNRDVFDRVLTTHYGKINSEILENLWNAYKQDISSISSAPPFSKWSAIVRKPIDPQPTGFTPPHEDIVEQKEEAIVILESPIKTRIEPVILSMDQTREIEPSVQIETGTNPLEEEPKSSERITRVSQDLIGLAKYLPSTEKVTIEFGNVKFELRDESSIELAKVLIQVKENGLLRGNDHEQK